MIASRAFRPVRLLVPAMGVGARPASANGGRDSAIPPEHVCPDPSGDAAPRRDRKVPVEPLAVAAVGMSSMQGRAATDACGTRAQQTIVRENDMIRQYVGTTSPASSRTVGRANAGVSRLVGSDALSGSRIVRTAMGARPVPVGFDPSVTRDATERVVKTGMGNDRAARQRCKGAEGQDERAGEIARVSPGGN